MASGLARALGDATLADQGGADYTPGAILVTGGAGFIASHVVIRLVGAGHKVRENKLSYETARSVSPVCALLPLRTSHPSSHWRVGNTSAWWTGGGRMGGRRWSGRAAAVEERVKKGERWSRPKLPTRPAHSSSRALAHLTAPPHPLTQVIVLDKLDYCASLKNLDSVKGKSNFKVRRRRKG